MSLAPGVRLGAYEVVSLIGAGGMGEVYRARDLRLARDVAIKVLPDAFTNDVDRLARFKREAQVLASLNHPNIAAIHGVEETTNGNALVLEFVDGETLADRIVQGAIPLDEALAIAKQIAEALETAHAHGIIHRDLKPANIKVTPRGKVKVLDFGLAKPSEGGGSGLQADLSASPTITSPAMTVGRVILGTAAYMSPEQAKGKPVDRRTDIWAFGCVLYEMISGKPAFTGSDVVDVSAAILAKEPDWNALDPSTPSTVRRLLRRCLAKDTGRRLADVADARLEIEDVVSGVADSRSSNLSPPVQIGRTRAWRLPWALGIIALVALAAFSLLRSPSLDRAPLPMLQVSAELGAPVSLVTTQGPGAILSPDGTTLAFVGQPVGGAGAPHLYIRRLDQFSAQALPGTEGAMNPFFSPDGRWIGFFAGGKLMKIATAGGPAIALANAPNGRGGDWGDDDHLVYMPDFYAGLWRVSSSGGAPTRVTTPSSGHGTDRWQLVLPGSKAVVFTRHTSLTGYENADIMLQPLPSGEPRVLHRGGYYGRYVASGHLVYMQGGALFAAAFDMARLERAGEPVPIVQDVAGGGFWTGAAQFSISNLGTAVYVRGSSSATPIQRLDKSGGTETLRPDAVNWSDPTFAPDGRRLALTIFDGKQSDIWIYDSERGATSRLTMHTSDDFKPVWTPDGRRVAYTSHRGGNFSVFWQRVDGTDEAQPLWRGASVATSWHPSGKFLAFDELHPQTSFDLKILPIEGSEASGWKPGQAIAVLNGPAVEIEGMFSPDGRWLAYASNESGRFEVYVRPFPGPGGAWQISSGGGTLPTWSRTTKELLYGTLDQRIMSVSYSVDGGSFRVAAPRVWAEGRYRMLGPVVNRHFDLHPDGRTLVLSKVPDAGGSDGDQVVFAFNLFDELRRVVR